MDARNTLPSRTTFLELLKDAYQSNIRVHLLVDDNGLVRAEGYIETISADTEKPFITLENGLTIALQQIAAVNGVFLPEYAEC